MSPRTVRAALRRVAPRDRGAPHDAYFAELQRELRAHGPMRPCVIIDLDHLDHNIDTVIQSVRRVPGRALRIVEKSLPAPGLLRYILARAGTERLMSFHQPFLSQDARLFPTCDLLLGKPLPVRAAEIFYRQHEGTFDPARQLQWLIDSAERLVAYRELARGLRTKLRVNVEIDIGLHRGGVADRETASALFRIIEESRDVLELSGFMGYDPFVAKIPASLGLQRRALEAAMRRYREFVDHLRQMHPRLWSPALVLDTGGSPTYRLHEEETLTTEVAVGSGLLKPARFDLPTLADHRPAVFLAAPVLKTQPLRFPVLEAPSRLLAAVDPNSATSVFLYGGDWPADVVSPPGLRKSPLFSPSANHEGYAASARTQLRPDDHVFFRPHQTEATLLRFGDLLAVRGGKIQDRWPPLQG